MGSRMAGYPFDKQFAGGAKPNQKHRIEGLSKVELFEGLSKSNLAQINKIAWVRFAQAGEVLVREGEPGDEMLVVLDGTASVSHDGKEFATCAAGSCIGEMALLDDEPRSATVTATEEMRVVVIPRAEFRKLLPKLPALAETLLATLSRRLREARATPQA
jgi:CRP-like cAMP-binding protein